MSANFHYRQHHKSHRAPYVRAGLMGANDGLVSLSALLLGIIASQFAPNYILLTGVQALVSGSLSMFVGEYVAVSSQRDAELADIEMEKQQHLHNTEQELMELKTIYIQKGLPDDLAETVAHELSKGDAVRIHVREELGIDVDNLSKPWLAAVSSGVSFCIGGLIPLLTSIIVKERISQMISITVVTILAFTVFGIVSATIGGASRWRASLRILIFGSLILGIMFCIGHFWPQGGTSSGFTNAI